MPRDQKRTTGYSRSIEDYLKAIYEIETQGRPAATSAIADALAVAAPSVSGMVKRLSEAGLVEHAPYRGVQLTRAGRRAALKMVRRHRVLETYLTSKLGYDWDSVHDEAERLEHAVSDGLIERMAMALGNPLYDPHGAPIPTAEGEIESPSLEPLSEIPVGTTVEIRMVSDRDPDRLRYLGTLGLRPGVAVEVVARQPFQGPATVRFLLAPTKVQVVGHALATALFCAPVEGEVG